MSRASSSVSRRLGMGVICCTCSSWPSLGHLSCSRSNTNGRPVLLVIFGGQILLLERAIGQRCAGADCGPSAPGNRSWPFRLRGSGWRRMCRPASRLPSPMEWQAMQPRVSKASLPFSGSPGFCCGRSPVTPDCQMNAAMARISPSSRRKVGILVPGRHLCGSFSHTGIHSLCSFMRTSFRLGPDLLDLAHQAARAHVELLDLGVEAADAHLQIVGVLRSSFLASSSLVRGLLAFCSLKPTSRVHSAFCCSNWRICWLTADISSASRSKPS